MIGMNLINFVLLRRISSFVGTLFCGCETSRKMASSFSRLESSDADLSAESNSLCSRYCSEFSRWPLQFPLSCPFRENSSSKRLSRIVIPAHSLLLMHFHSLHRTPQRPRGSRESSRNSEWYFDCSGWQRFAELITLAYRDRVLGHEFFK